MRTLVFTLAVLMATIGGAEAAQSTWLGDLLGLNRHAVPVHRHASPKPAAKPDPASAPTPAPVSARPDTDKTISPDAGASSPAPAKAEDEKPPKADAPLADNAADTVSGKGSKPAVPLPEARPTPPAEDAQPPAPAKAAPERPASQPAAPESEPTPGGSGDASAPQSTPGRVFQTACPAVVSGAVEAKALPPISQGQCVARSPLSLTGVMVEGREIAVKGGAETDCAVASSLGPWLKAVDGYVFSRLHSHLKAITVGGSFACRDRRTGEPNDTLSEHAFADALDVMSFTLDNGKTIDVADGWKAADSEDGRMLRFTHNAACSVFMTTLGPEANALHYNHFHVDMGCHGKSCTYRMCE